jgi:hypothetical protein
MANNPTFPKTFSVNPPHLMSTKSEQMFMELVFVAKSKLC